MELDPHHAEARQHKTRHQSCATNKAKETFQQVAAGVFGFNRITLVIMANYCLIHASSRLQHCWSVHMLKEREVKNRRTGISKPCDFGQR
jgi:hypothetical protein